MELHTSVKGSSNLQSNPLVTVPFVMLWWLQPATIAPSLDPDLGSVVWRLIDCSFSVEIPENFMGFLFCTLFRRSSTIRIKFVQFPLVFLGNTHAVSLNNSLWMHGPAEKKKWGYHERCGACQCACNIAYPSATETLHTNTLKGSPPKTGIKSIFKILGGPKLHLGYEGHHSVGLDLTETRCMGVCVFCPHQKNSHQSWDRTQVFGLSSTQRRSN